MYTKVLLKAAGGTKPSPLSSFSVFVPNAMSCNMTGPVGLEITSKKWSVLVTSSTYAMNLLLCNWSYCPKLNNVFLDIIIFVSAKEWQ